MLLKDNTYDINAMRQTACMVICTLMVNRFASSLFAGHEPGLRLIIEFFLSLYQKADSGIICHCTSI